MNRQQPQQPEAPQPPIPPVQPPYVPPAGQTYQPAPGQSPPGQVFGILSIVFPFIGLSIIGLVFGIISMNQAAKARASKTLGLVGTILSAIFTLIGIAWIGLFIFAAAHSYTGIQERAKEVSTQSSAQQSTMTHATSVMNHAEAYYTINNKYPQSIADFEANASSSLKSLTEQGVTVGTATPTDEKTIQYKPCGSTGAVIIYYSMYAKQVEPIYIGDGSETTCKVSR